MGTPQLASGSGQYVKQGFLCVSRLWATSLSGYSELVVRLSGVEWISFVRWNTDRFWQLGNRNRNDVPVFIINRYLLPTDGPNS